jgi:nucleoside-diphosphate-sugar epimerase
MRILVTGASGFLGSHVAERLASRDGIDLRLLLRPASRLTFLDGVAYERAGGDVRDAASLARALEGIDAVVHLAGLVSALTEAQYHEVNASGTASLVEAARQAGVKRFVYVSSLAALGPSDDGAVPETPHPVGPYGRSKLAGEYPVLAARDAMSVAVVRPPVVYGERDRALIPFYRLARFGFVPVYGAGDRRLTWVHVHDAAEAIVATALVEGPSGAVYSISDGATHTWRSLVGAWSRASGRRVRALPTPPALFALAGYAGGLAQAILRKPLPLSPEEVKQMRQHAWLCDHAAITRDLGWQPSIDIEQGFAQSYAWYRQQGWL